MKPTLITLALALALAAPPALAWSRQGHQLVGELAERELSPAALAQVQDLLADEPNPSLAGVSTWADEIRAAESELGKLSQRWHYVNIPGDDCDYDAARDCPDGECVIGAINAQASVLGDASRPRQERIDALKFLVHFVGDAHQPMHAGYPHDRGGNRHQLNYTGKGSPEGEGTNLHGVWDYWIVQGAGMDTADYADHLQTLALPSDPAAGLDNPAQAWTLESCRLIKAESLYPPGRRITDAYLDQHRPVAEARLRLAGARLAALLEKTLVP
ncbi:endonuclease [Arenimonas soli]|uniref:Endonuclease n=1 Tax=Arenimonas soli TaxID=2269504 RepID=A0ABQ1H9W9_9GAMM|nr:S1/P1 nuclease [Arenimonas soli]GGA67408.1 endonuclease [Arenimonas soli]